MLIHDGQYTDQEYATTIGWGHSRVRDALTFGKRADARRVALFHHDPTHDDAMLDELAGEAQADWDGDGELTFAREGEVVVL